MLNITVDDLLRSGVSRLEEVGIDTARLDCLVLLEDATGQDRGWLLAHPEHELHIEIVQKLNKQIARRALHEPLAYIRGKAEFYGREFHLNQHVLMPRPESEAIIDLLKNLPLPQGSTIADIGTGSGALAITAKLEIPEAKLTAVDIDQACLDIASQNAEALGAEIQLLQGDLLKPLSAFPAQPFALLCNLPYVPNGFPINQAAAHEPRIALFGGIDGLDIYRNLFKQIGALAKNKPHFVLVEALPLQHNALTKIARATGFNLQISAGFIQLFQLR